MKQKSTQVLGSATMRVFLSLVLLVTIAINAMAQTLPCIPPSGYDTSGQYPAGAINTVSYYSSVAGKDLNMMVYTPPNYNSNQRYPVIYCYQGVSTGIDTIFDDWCVDAGIVADNLIGQQKIHPVILVAIDDQFNGTYDSDVAKMTIVDAIPYVDSHYSTFADADHRGVYGFSWGGGYAFNVGCGNLDSFHHISPSSAAPDKAGDDQLFPNGGIEAKQKMRTLLISCGDSDWLGLYPSSLNCHNYCVSNGITDYWLSVPGGNHDAGSVWRPAMWNFLQLADQKGISSNPSITGAVRFVARHSGKVLCANANQTENGSPILQWTYWGGNNQQFFVSADGSFYKIIEVQTGKAVEVNGGDTNGAKVQLGDYTGQPYQKFSFKATDSGYYEIVPSHAPGSCLDVEAISGNDGAAVHLWGDWGGANQQWAIQAVDPAPPTITSLSPVSVNGATTFTLTVNGTNFIPGCIIKWNGTNMATTYVSSTQLTTTINKYYTTLASYPGSGTVSILNPDGTRSASGTVTITAPIPVPAITSLSPSTVSGAKSFTLTVNGTNFESGSIIKWNGTNMTTTFVSATQLTASINKYYTTPASYPGSATVSVLNPEGTRSSGATITITAPLPVISSLSPSSIQGATTFTLTVNGSNFVNGSIIKWNGTNMTTTYVSSTQLTASINKYYDTLASYPGSATVSVLNPDGGRSASATLTITQPITPPAITSLSPSSIKGATTFTLTVNGTNFGSGSIIKWNGTNMATTYVSSTQLTATINKYYTTMASYPGSATVSILNPDGGRSTSATLAITTP